MNSWTPSATTVPFDLRWNGKVYRTVNARELWFKIVKNAHASAEPGIIFWDTMRDFHNVEYANPLTSTNPCGEQPLAAYTACNLGNINLSKFVGCIRTLRLRTSRRGHTCGNAVHG